MNNLFTKSFSGNQICKSWLLTTISAVLYSVAFIIPGYFWWTVIISLGVLGYLFFAEKKCSFAHGFIWGVIIWAIQLIAILVFLIEHGTGSVIIRIAAWMFLVFYLSIYSGIWFFINKRVIQFSAHDFKIIVLLISSTSILFFWWIERAVFFIFGRWFGYPFFNPLLPLVVMSSFFLSNQEAPSWLDMVTVIQPIADASAWKRAYAFLHDCQSAIKKKPKTKIIITPESAFPFALNGYPEFIELWSNYPGLQHVHFLIGAHRQQGQYLYNSLFHIHNGRIIQHYDKITTLLIAEEVPKHKIWQWTKQLFLKDKQPICSSSAERKAIKIDEIPPLMPFICSDLFFCYEMPKGEETILCIANDSWFSLQYMKKLMHAAIQLKSYFFNKRILYINY